MAHWFFDTPGIGAIVVFVVFLSVFSVYFSLIRWIQTAPPDAESGDGTLALDVDE